MEQKAQIKHTMMSHTANKIINYHILTDFNHTHAYTTILWLWILSGTTWVSGYQKKHSPTHTYHGQYSVAVVSSGYTGYVVV